MCRILKWLNPHWKKFSCRFTVAMVKRKRSVHHERSGLYRNSAPGLARDALLGIRIWSIRADDYDDCAGLQHAQTVWRDHQDDPASDDAVVWWGCSLVSHARRLFGLRFLRVSAADLRCICHTLRL